MEEQNFTESTFSVPKTKQQIRALIAELPNSSGIYKFLDKSYKPLYIGKAKYINKRLASYFRKSAKTLKIKRLVEESRYIQLALTNTELESLLLEQFQIKEHKPKFNVQFKDDKGYPWIKIDSNKEFPSAQSFLGKGRQNGKFFGPFPNSYAVRNTLKLIQNTFKIRNCSEAYFKNRTRPCLQYEIGRCSGPCVGLIKKKEYLDEVKGAELLLAGKSEELISKFYLRMDKFSLKKNFEKAAVYRDRISALRDIQRSQSVSGFKQQKDAIYLSRGNGQVKVGITHVFNGWVTGHQNFIQKDESIEEDVLGKFITQKYCTNKMCPPVLLVNGELKEKVLIESALSEYHSKKISIIIRPRKKDKGLLEVCKTNTEFLVNKGKSKRNIALILQELGKQLNIKKDINVIESYDISHHAGDYAVGGSVVYSKEGKRKDLYRLYNISKENSGKDIASMAEVIERRFRTVNLDEIPDLIIIDGGKSHLKFAMNKFKSLNIIDINVIAISKGARRKSSFDSIHLSNGKSISAEEGSSVHSLIQEIRDETHRYSISLQKKKRSKTSIGSSIDSLTGIGPIRKRSLLRYFGSIEQIKRASVEDLSQVSGIGNNIAKLIFEEIRT